METSNSNVLEYAIPLLYPISSSEFFDSFELCQVCGRSSSFEEKKGRREADAATIILMAGTVGKMCIFSIQNYRVKATFYRVSLGSLVSKGL